MWCFFKFSDINNSLSIYSHVPGECTMLIFAKLRADERLPVARQPPSFPARSRRGPARGHSESTAIVIYHSSLLHIVLQREQDGNQATKSSKQRLNVPSILFLTHSWRGLIKVRTCTKTCLGTVHVRTLWILSCGGGPSLVYLCPRWRPGAVHLLNLTSTSS